MFELKTADLFTAQADLIIIPISSNATISALFDLGLSRNRIPFRPKKAHYALGSVEIQLIATHPFFRYIALACTVDNYTSNYAAVRNIGRAIGKVTHRLPGIKTVATPFLGTGTGGLDHSESGKIMYKAFTETSRSDVQLTFYTPDQAISAEVSMEIQENRPDDFESSGFQVISTELRQITQTQPIANILADPHFYYELGRQKFMELLQFKASVPDFYHALLEEFKQSKLHFQQFLAASDQSLEKKTYLTLCGELIAYLDEKAYQKVYWNQYPDHRTVARSGVNQDNWFINITNLKTTNNRISGVKANNVRNALNFLNHPRENIPMLSDEHRKMVTERLLLQKYNPSTFSQSFISYFGSLSLSCENRINESTLYTKILYLPKIASLWKEDEEDKITIYLNEKDDNSIFLATQLIGDCLNKQSLLLDLGRCGLTDLDHIPELFECTHIETLILSNEWGEFSDGEFVRRVSANRGPANALNHLPDRLRMLKNLNTLICGGNWKSRKGTIPEHAWKIKDISVIATLKKLRILNVSNNDIEKIDSLSKLKNLEKAYLNNNRIVDVRPLSSLMLLHELYLSNNNISDISSLGNLNSLKTLDVHSNKISDITPIRQLIATIGIADTKWEFGSISITAEFLKTPTPEIIRQGKDNVLAYFKQLEAEQRINLPTHTNWDLKLIVVGNSNAGKSTLIYWLINEVVKLDLPTTHWMVVENWKPEKYNIRIFDFGGQEYYHDTHHIFFTNRTAYIVLWEPDTETFGEIGIEQKQQNGQLEKVRIQTFPLQYWLDSISFHTRRKNKSYSERQIDKLIEDRDNLISPSPVSVSPRATEDIQSNILIAQNKVDSAHDRRFLNQVQLKEDHPRIYDFTSISVKYGKGLEHFKRILFDIFESLPILGSEYPGTWGAIKTKIEGSIFANSYTIDQFRNYCNEIIRQIPEVKEKSQSLINEVLFTAQDAKSFAQYLNDIGILLYFPETDGLTDEIFLNQKQVLENIYDILSGLKVLKGQFDTSHVLKVLKKSDFDDEAQKVIRLMLHFKIIFEHPTRENTYIAPLYLPKEPATSIKLFTPLFKNARYRFKYERFIHKNVILDFFNKYGKDALKDRDGSDFYYYWKEGIIVRNESTGEIVMVKFFPGKGDDNNAYIDIFEVNTINGNPFLQKIIADLDIINEDWGVTKCVSADGIHFVPLKLIHEKEEADIWQFMSGERHFRLIDFKKFLRNPTKMKKIFISYSKQDLTLVNKFIEHLSALHLDGKVAHWYCSELEAGTDWNEEIQKHLEESDIICFMVSPNFMKTKYIHENEIKYAFKRKEEDKKFNIVPIILDFCRWTTTTNNLGKYTALPYTAKPVVDFRDQNMAWYIIQECLRVLIDEELVDPKDDDLYSNPHLPADVLKLFERIIAGKVDN